MAIMPIRRTTVAVKPMLSSNKWEVSACRRCTKAALPSKTVSTAARMAGTNKRRSAPKDEARRIAANVAKLPGLLGREDYGLSATGAGAPAHPAYNPWVNRLNAIRLLQVLIAAGASSRAPMNPERFVIAGHETCIRHRLRRGGRLVRRQPKKKRLD